MIHFESIFIRCEIECVELISLSSIDLSILMPVSHCFDYCSFINFLQAGNVSSSTFLFFQIVFCYSRSSAFMHKF